MSNIRNTQHADLEGIKRILDATALFPSAYLEGMIAPYMDDPQNGEIWITALNDGADPIGFAYAVPEKFTEGTYNLLAIAVDPLCQSRGTGQQLVKQVEQQLAGAGDRILLVETSSDAQYAATRRFYEKLEYRLVATIPEFWKAGEDKLVFWKSLQ